MENILQINLLNEEYSPNESFGRDYDEQISK